MFAPRGTLTMDTARHWNQPRISGILSPGGRSERHRSQGPEARSKMRSFLIALAGVMLFAAGAAQAKVSILVDKDSQTMTVAVDGVERYQWPVSSGNPSHETPNGSFKAFRMEEDHYSKEFDDAPMPHSIFFTKEGHAIHGTESEGRLGSPVSHGCVRLSRANATTLYALVQQQGVLNTTVTLTGSASVALARNPRSRPAAVARRDTNPQYPGSQYAPQYGAAGEPMDITPRQLPPQQYAPQMQGQYAPQQPYAPPQYAPQYAQRPQYAPQQRADDGYFYPADGSSDGARYPAPPSSRRLYDARAYQYYDSNGYLVQSAPPPGYPPRQYYQQRGYFE
jgi:hypothetical protein